jgi:hypothetical protein
MAVIEAPEAPKYEANDILGVDLGIKNLRQIVRVRSFQENRWSKLDKDTPS